ncbi:hypothetical protein ACFE04_023534 [Oxalis oulophora]
MGSSNGTNLLSPANFSMSSGVKWHNDAIKSKQNKSNGSRCSAAFTFLLIPKRYDLVCHHLLSGCHGLLMDLLHKDEQRDTLEILIDVQWKTWCLKSSSQMSSIFSGPFHVPVQTYAYLLPARSAPTTVALREEEWVE